MADNSNKDPLLSNKIAAAALAALLLVLGLPQLTAAIFGGGGHGGGHGEELHLAYCCVDLETEAHDAVVEAPADLGTLLASASAAGGERRAALCKSCHTFEEGGANGAGPNLWNIVERDVASVAGFNYTSALTEFGGAWTYERLNEYIKNSQEYVPGTAMVQRFAKDEQRADILAYLGSLSASPVAFPAPVIVEETAALEDAAETVGDAVGELVDDMPVEAAIEAGEDAVEAAEDVIEH